MPDTAVTRSELERRLSETMAQILKEHREANQHQDEAWNLGFRAVRSDFTTQLSIELRHFESLLEAKLDPLRKVSYGSVALLVSVLLIGLSYFMSHQGRV